MLRHWPVLLAALVLAGCTPSAPPLAAAPAAKIPGGWTVKDVPDQGLSIAVAPGWKAGSGEVQDPKAMFADMGGDTPSPGGGNSQNPMDAMMRDMDAKAQADEAKAMKELQAKGIIIRVNNVSIKPVFGEDPTRYQVRIMANPAGSLEAAANTLLEKVPGEEKPAKIMLAMGPAIVIKATKKMIDGGIVTTSKYVMQDGKTMIVVSFVTEADPNAIRGIEKQVMDTFRVVPGKANPPKPGTD